MARYCSTKSAIGFSRMQILAARLAMRVAKAYLMTSGGRSKYCPYESSVML
jgi:hypothetical protein